MRIATLSQRHPTYDAELCARYDALYRGGHAFRAALEQGCMVAGEVMQFLPKPLFRFLPQNPSEPDSVYQMRVQEAHYRSYVGPIVDYFAAKLFSAQFDAKATQKDRSGYTTPYRSNGFDVEPHPFYASLKEDCDLSGTDLVDFMRARLTSALVKGVAWVLAELPEVGEEEPLNEYQTEARQLGRAYLCPLEREQVIDWSTDDHGDLEWAIVYAQETPRAKPTDERLRIRETWRVYDRENVETFVAEWTPTRENRPEEAKSVGKKPHRFSRVPLVRLGFVGSRGVKLSYGGRTVSVSGSAVEGLWILNRVADAQIEHFRLSCALGWNIRRTCYAMPVFQLASEASDPIMGAGYFIRIGENEKVTWAAPPTAHLDVIATQIDNQRQEIYRIANQMAQGIDNNAAAIGRSGESKAVDAAAVDVCLSVYGAVVREPIEQIYQLISDGRGEDLDWHISGLDTFTSADPAVVIENLLKATSLQIPSATARRLFVERAIEVMLPNLSEKQKAQILKELEEAVTAESVAPRREQDDDPEDDDQEDEDGDEEELPAAA